VAVLYRWRLDVGTTNADGANAMAGCGIDKLIPSLFSVDIIIFTSNKSEHSDSPWCEPITPLFLEILRLYWKSRNMPVDGASYTVRRTEERYYEKAK
jgi:hypothetical protein